MKRLISIALALVMCLGMVSMLFVTSGAEEAEAPIKMVARNLSFRDSVAIKYAFQADSAERQLKLLVWTSPEDEYVLGTEDACITDYVIRDIKTSSGTLTGCHVFDYTALTAKQMTDVIYVRACYEDGGNVYYSACDNNMKYSILEYAYRMLGKIDGAATTNETLLNLLEKTLEYGAAAQLYTTSSVSAYKPDRLATADWVQVKLTAGSLEDGFSKGLYIPGTKATLTAPATRATGTTFDHWEDSAGNVVSTTASFELTVGTTNEVYTPVYYSLGLEYEDGYVVGVGTWTGTELEIPPVAPDGSAVVGIDTTDFQGLAITSLSLPSTLEEIASAGTFKGCAALTSVSIAAGLPVIPSSTFQDCTALEYVILPDTLTQIGRNAFSGCTKLQDVYYDGTEEEWNEITISGYTADGGNAPLFNAIKHFSAAVVETFTVTFVNYDGAVLKTETVESGKSATAPADPTRTGYAFAGWDVAFDNITGDLTVTATYTLNVTAPTVVVHDVVANVGDTTVDVVIAIANNPGIGSMKFDVTSVAGLTLKSFKAGSSFAGIVGPPKDASGAYKSQTFNWASASNVTADATFVTLTFEIADTITTDTAFDISVTLDAGNIFNVEGSLVSFEALAGRVIIQR